MEVCIDSLTIELTCQKAGASTLCSDTIGLEVHANNSQGQGHPETLTSYYKQNRIFLGLGIFWKIN